MSYLGGLARHLSKQLHQISDSSHVVDKMELLGLFRQPTENLALSCLIATGFAVSSHLLYYIHDNKVPQTVGILAFHVVSGSLLLIGSVIGWGLAKGVVHTLAIATSYLVTLYSSIIIYRIFFHPLRHFPGPFPAKISKLYNVWIAKHLHIHQTEWVERYGSSIIRIGIQLH